MPWAQKTRLSWGFVTELAAVRQTLVRFLAFGRLGWPRVILRVQVLVLGLGG